VGGSSILQSAGGGDRRGVSAPGRPTVEVSRSTCAGSPRLLAVLVLVTTTAAYLRDGRSGRDGLMPFRRGPSGARVGSLVALT